jgi:hypothetical protein
MIEDIAYIGQVIFDTDASIFHKAFVIGTIGSVPGEV